MRHSSNNDDAVINSNEEKRRIITNTNDIENGNGFEEEKAEEKETIDNNDNLDDQDNRSVETKSLNKNTEIDTIPDLSADEVNVLKARKTCLHLIFDAYRYIAAFAAVNMSIGVFVSLCLFDLTLIEYITRVFMSAICVFIVISEIGGDSNFTTLCGGSMM